MLQLDSIPVRVSFTGLCTARELEAKISSFTDLFGSAPIIHVSGTFDCTDGDPVFARFEKVTCVGTKYVEVDLGEEGRCKFDPRFNTVTYLFSPA